MKTKRTSLRIIVASFATALLSLAILTHPARAIDLTNVVDKYNLSQLAQCYTEGHMEPTVTYTDLIGITNAGDHVTFGKIVQPSSENYSIVQMNRDEGYNINGMPSITACSDVLQEKYSELLPKGNNPTEEELDKFMGSMGYIAKSKPGKCAVVELYNNKNELSKQVVCASNSGELTATVVGETFQAVYPEVEGNSVYICYTYSGVLGMATNSCDSKMLKSQTKITYDGNMDTFASNFYTMINIITRDLDKYKGTWKVYEPTGASEQGYKVTDTDILNKFYTLNKLDSGTWQAISSVEQALSYAKQALNTFLSTLSNGTYKSLDDLKFTNDELSRFLVEAVLTGYYQSVAWGSDSELGIMSCKTVAVEHQQTAISNDYIRYDKTGNPNGPACYIRAGNTTLAKRSVPVGITNGLFDGTQKTYAEVVAMANQLAADAQLEVYKSCKQKFEVKLSSLSGTLNHAPTNTDAYKKAKAEYDYYISLLNGNDRNNIYAYATQDDNGVITCVVDTESSYIPPTEDFSKPSDSTDSDPNASDLSACYKNAGVLGWITCPVVSAVGGVTTSLYSIVEKQLNIHAGVVDSGGVRQGWSQIRNFANILFAIAFLIVILAQVTGIGISNYNIKKILPRLIMVVILVNLSFIICQLAVDVSNILGSGLKSMFEGFASDIKINNKTASANTGALVGAILTDLVVVGGTGSAVVALLGFTIPWETWLFPVILALVGVLISVLFFFIIIAVRQAGIVILIVLAPAAIVCYALPNTQSLYKRWQNMFVSLLLVYPICGALMGGGEFASRLLLYNSKGAGDGGFLTTVARLVQPVPFFFIPTILRNSMTALGNIGNKIAGIGSRFSGGLQSAVRGSRAFQDHQAEANRAADLRRDNKLINRSQRALNRLNDKRTNPNDPNDVSGLNRVQRSRYNSLQRRLSRTNDRLERATREDQRAILANAQGNITYMNSARYKNMMADITEPSRNQAIKDQQARYLNGEEGINMANNEQVENEYRRVLTKAMANPFNEDAQIRAIALQNEMAKTNKGRGSMSKVLSHITTNTSSDDIHGNRGLQRVLNNYADNLSGKVKGVNPALDKMIHDMRGASDVESSFSAYAAAGAKKLTASTIGDADDEMLESLLKGVENGSINGSALDHVMKIAHEARTNPNIHLEEGAKSKIDQILAAGYSHGTAGAGFIADANNEILSNIIKTIDRTDLTIPADVSQARKIVENAQRALQSGKAYDQDTIDLYQKIISTARDRGIKDVRGNDYAQVDSAAISVRDAGPAERELINYADEGFISTTDNKGRTHWKIQVQDANGNTITRSVSPAEMERIKEIREINRIIREENIKNGYVPRGSGGGTPTP